MRKVKPFTASPANDQRARDESDLKENKKPQKTLCGQSTNFSIIPYTFDTYSSSNLHSHLKLPKQYIAQHRKLVDPPPTEAFYLSVCVTSLENLRFS